MGAHHFVLCGDDDQGVLDTLSDVTENFGGDFSSEHHPKPMGFLRHFAKQRGPIIHLPMNSKYHDTNTSNITTNAN